MIASLTPSGARSVFGWITWIPIDFMLGILRDWVIALPKTSRAQVVFPIASASPFSPIRPSILDQVSSSM
jgi:hypothetical protein